MLCPFNICALRFAPKDGTLCNWYMTALICESVASLGRYFSLL